MITVKSCSYSETVRYGTKAAAAFRHGGIVLLFGGLGAGKTAFTNGIAKAFGIEEHIVSPTFTLLNIYQGSGIELCHFDLYRLGGSADEIEEAGLDEFFYKDNTLCVIEWPEYAEQLLNGPYIKVRFDFAEDEIRQLTFETVGCDESELRKALLD